MLLGLVGAGNIAHALARGWSQPLVCTDAGSGRAGELAAEVGGEALASNRELAARADLIVLCHKPAQLGDVALELADARKPVVSTLGGVTIEALRGAYPHSQVFRMLPNTPAEVRRGTTLYAPAPGVDRDLEREVVGRFELLGRVVTVDERLIDVAMGVCGVGPAYVALIAEAWVDAAVKRGLKAPVAADLVVETLAGTAELLRARTGDTLALRREVTSPGGSTARGLAALERARVRAAMVEALDAVLGR